MPGGLCIVRCERCSLVYLNPRLTPEAGGHLEGEGDFYEFSGQIVKERIETLFHMVAGFERFIPRCQRKRKRGRLLDVGCNRGFLLEAARRRGWDVMGVESSKIPAEKAREEFGLDVYGQMSELSGLEPFDIVVAWHVVEHTTDPVGFLRRTASAMRSDGILALQVPSFEFLEEYRKREELHKLVCALHNFYFTEDTLRSAICLAGLSPKWVLSNPKDLMLTAICVRQDSGQQGHSTGQFIGPWGQLFHRILRLFRCQRRGTEIAKFLEKNFFNLLR